MRGRGAIVGLSVLLVAAIGVIAYLALTGPSTPQTTSTDSDSGTSTGSNEKPASSGAKDSRALFAEVRKAYEGPGEKDRKAALARIRTREVTAALSEVARDAGASMEERQGAFGMLSSAHVSSSVLFPLILELDGEKNPGLAGCATEALASMLERGDKVSDEEKATKILIASSRPSSDSSSRRAAARGLAALKNKEAIKALVALLSDEDSLARRFSFQALKKLSGDTFGYDYRAKPEAQKSAIAKWKAWAESYSPKAD